MMTRHKPEQREIVLVVPQSWAYVMSLGNGRNMVGKSATAIKEFIDQGRGPYFKQYETGMPWKGTGLMVVRDGKLALGPENFDSGD